MMDQSTNSRAYYAQTYDVSVPDWPAETEFYYDIVKQTVPRTRALCWKLLVGPGASRYAWQKTSGAVSDSIFSRKFWKSLIGGHSLSKEDKINEAFEIINVDASNVKQLGFFCYMSKPKTPGYKQKLDWVEARFAEGMNIKIIHETAGRNTGFIETIPGEYAWRAVYAPGYNVIHCVWVVGKGKGKGYGTHLVQACLADARAQNKHGVVMVTSDRIWLAKSSLFLKNGFVEIDQAPPCFHLLANRFDSAPLPSFPDDWAERQVRFGPGLTVVRTAQCPYIENAVAEIVKFAQEHDIPAKVVELHSAQEVQTSSPSAYGVFGVVLDGQLFAYHYLQRKDYERLLDAVR